MTIEELTQNHPCFAQGAKINKGRVHLPVSPGCNIACKFCDRQLNGVDQRPGVASTIITPAEAVELVRRAVRLCPEIAVAGEAGPGDSLATPYALQAFRLIQQEFPHIIKCMSTNGLQLPAFAGEMIALGIDSLTVTVNAVDPVILAQIVEGVAPDLLIHNQLAGIAKISAAGVAVKVNTVLLPGVNAQHIPKIAQRVAAAGAQRMNIIPLIPQHKLSHIRAPGCREVACAREAAEQYLPVFRHCQRCRADAAGLLGGQDFAQELYGTHAAVQNTFSHG
jgi:nitrogen fixation protein NifB